MPWVERPYIYNVRSTPRNIKSLTGSRDLQMVDINLRVIYRPMVEKLPDMYRTLGMDYDERVRATPSSLCPSDTANFFVCLVCVCGTVCLDQTPAPARPACPVRAPACCLPACPPTAAWPAPGNVHRLTVAAWVARCLYLASPPPPHSHQSPASPPRRTD